MKKYRFTFDPWGLFLFLLIMLPNFIWFVLPAPNDILRGKSATPVLDSAASICQVLIAAALCGIVNRERGPLRLSPLIFSAGSCVLFYYAGWALYYMAFTGPAVISLLTLPPCLALMFFAIDRRNLPAVFLIACFTLCHLIYAVVNFIL